MLFSTVKLFTLQLNIFGSLCLLTEIKVNQHVTPKYPRMPKIRPHSDRGHNQAKVLIQASWVVINDRSAHQASDNTASKPRFSSDHRGFKPRPDVAWLHSLWACSPTSKNPVAIKMKNVAVNRRGKDYVGWRNHLIKQMHIYWWLKWLLMLLWTIFHLHNVP